MLRLHTEFADPPPPLPDLSHLSISSPEPREPEPVVPVENPPTTLIQWAVLILNTADPMLKVRVLFPWQQYASLRYDRCNVQGMRCSSFAPASSSPSDTARRRPQDRRRFLRARRRTREIRSIRPRWREGRTGQSCCMRWPTSSSGRKWMSLAFVGCHSRVACQN